MGAERLPCTLHAVTIMGGAQATSDQGDWNVPKRDLVSTAPVLLQGGRLKVAEALPEAATLTRELLAFKVTISAAGHDSYAAWREGDHDDLVLATALACWMGEHGGDLPFSWLRKDAATVALAQTLRPQTDEERIAARRAAAGMTRGDEADLPKRERWIPPQ